MGNKVVQEPIYRSILETCSRPDEILHRFSCVPSLLMFPLLPLDAIHIWIIEQSIVIGYVQE